MPSGGVMPQKSTPNWETIENLTANKAAPLALTTSSGVTLHRFPESTIQPMRSMLTRLISQQSLPDRISVVSALRGEGVTYTTLGLATTLANDTTYNVCVVDLNWWWPDGQMRKLQARSKGFVGLLNKQAELEETLVQTSMPNLTLLPGGSVPTNHPPIFVGGREPNRIIEQLSTRFDHILLDIPAILATNDAIPLASLGSSCCVVVQQGASTTALIKRALRELSHIPTLGVLMNQAKFVTPGWIRNRISQG